MRAVIQVVDKASVSLDGKEVSSIEKGLLVLLGITASDNEEIARKMAEKIAKMRVFEDENGKINLSVTSVGGEILLVSQFTLYGSMKEGNRPSFVAAAPREISLPIYNKFAEILKSLCPNLKEGIFGGDMRVSLINHGPTTIIMDSEDLFR